MRLVSSIALAVCVSAPASAQHGGVDDRALSKARCEQALRNAGQAQVTQVRPNDLEALLRCGKDGATATARVIGATAQVQDTLVLSRLFLTVDSWRDADVMQAAISLARNRSASVDARVFAIEHLLGLLSPRTIFRYGTLVQGTKYTRDAHGTTVYPACRITAVSSVAPDTFATPLPADYATTIRTLLARMSNDRSLPQPLRNAAACSDKV